MSLQLDARQRAMLQEMGVQVWSPAPANSNSLLAEAHTYTAPVMPVPVSAAPLPLAAPVPVAVPDSSHALLPRLHPPQRLYASADGVPHTLAPPGGQIWLIVAEGKPGADPLANEAGTLLHHMLQALQLHQPPHQVFFCGVELSSSGFVEALQAPPQNVLSGYLAQLQPAMVLLMGRLAARAVLGRHDPLGQLRAQPHSVGDYPAIVTYEAPYLLRHGKYKAAAWADLCRARALVQAAYNP